MSRSDARAYLRALANSASLDDAAQAHIHTPGTADDLATFLETAAAHLRKTWRLGDRP